MKSKALRTRLYDGTSSTHGLFQTSIRFSQSTKTYCYKRRPWRLTMARAPCISTVRGFTNDPSSNPTMNDIFAPLEEIHFVVQFSTLLELAYQDSRSLTNTQPLLASGWANRTVFISSATTSVDGCIDASPTPSRGTKYDPMFRSLEHQDRQNTGSEGLASLSAPGVRHTQLREEIYTWLAQTEDPSRLSYTRQSEPEEGDSRTFSTPFGWGVKSPPDSRSLSTRSHSSTEARSQGEARGKMDSQPIKKALPQRFNDGDHAALLHMLSPSSESPKRTRQSFRREYPSEGNLAFYQGP